MGSNPGCATHFVTRGSYFSKTGIIRIPVSSGLNEFMYLTNSLTHSRLSINVGSWEWAVSFNPVQDTFPMCHSISRDSAKQIKQGRVGSTVICGLCSPGVSGPGGGHSRVLNVGDEWEAGIRRPHVKLKSEKGSA